MDNKKFPPPPLHSRPRVASEGRKLSKDLDGPVVRKVKRRVAISAKRQRGNEEGRKRKRKKEGSNDRVRRYSEIINNPFYHIGRCFTNSFLYLRYRRDAGLGLPIIRRSLLGGLEEEIVSFANVGLSRVYYYSLVLSRSEQRSLSLARSSAAMSSCGRLQARPPLYRRVIETP